MKKKILVIVGISIAAAAVLGLMLFGAKGSGSCGLSRGNAPAFQREARYAERAGKEKVMLAAPMAAVAVSPAQEPADTESGIPRKIIRNAYLTLEVGDCFKARDALLDLIKRRKGTLINTQLDEAEGSSKNGTVIFKVLPEELDAVVKEIRRFGKVRSESVSAQDVTESYMDLQTRLKSQRAVRDRFISILNDQAKQVKDIISVEKEIARLGVEIESLEGRIRYLDSQIDLSTVTVSFREDKVSIWGELDLGKRFKESLKAAVATFFNVIFGIIVIIAMAAPLALVTGAVWGGVIFIRKRIAKK